MKIAMYAAYLYKTKTLKVELYHSKACGLYIRVTFYKITLKLILKHLQKLRSHLKIKLK